MGHQNSWKTYWVHLTMFHACVCVCVCVYVHIKFVRCDVHNYHLCGNALKLIIFHAVLGQN